MIAPPSYLAPGALPAHRRVTDKLLALGLWEDAYSSMAFVTAQQCWTYLAVCETFGPRSEIAQETRRIARQLLQAMQYLKPLEAVEEDGSGRDCSLVALCAHGS